MERVEVTRRVKRNREYECKAFYLRRAKPVIPEDDIPRVISDIVEKRVTIREIMEKYGVTRHYVNKLKEQ